MSLRISIFCSEKTDARSLPLCIRCHVFFLSLCSLLHPGSVHSNLAPVISAKFLAGVKILDWLLSPSRDYPVARNHLNYHETVRFG